MSENEQDARRARLEALREDGVDPFPARVAERTPIAVLREPWEDTSAEVLEAEKPPAAIAGRIKALRSF
ncbi:MAG: lysine--tRNA ligase, partial [Deltaproteobacteria bacterium]|nr:lysine--tRNA ligase [Deltaproteobacteria bacterium]